MSEDWEFNRTGRKNSSYEQSKEHIRLIEEKGYQLQTFPMKYSDANKGKDGIGPAKIGGFVPKLTSKFLKRVGGNWYAADSDNAIRISLPEEVETPEQYFEGASTKISVNTYERNVKARAKCLEYHGHKCAVCFFDFELFYGAIGKNYIHVHHVVPLAKIKNEYELDPVKDLIPVCPNCHAIIHRTQPTLSIEQLRRHITGKNTANKPMEGDRTKV